MIYERGEKSFSPVKYFYLFPAFTYVCIYIYVLVMGGRVLVGFNYKSSRKTGEFIFETGARRNYCSLVSSANFL